MHVRWSRRSVLASGVGVGLVGLARPARAAPPRLRDGHGLEVVEARRVDDRLLRVRFRTAQVHTGPWASILLPEGYDRRRGRRYPVLHLLHGGGADHQQWHEQLEARESSAGRDVIIVMPDCNLVGWYADHRFPTDGPRNWRTFHLDQLLPWVDANFRTVPRASARAVAGLSMGGYGAQKYVAERPDLFAAVSSYSGPSDNTDPVLEQWIFLTVALDGQAPGAVYGPPLTHRRVRERENPWHRVESFRGKRVVLYCGEAGISPDAFADLQEHVVHAQNTRFHARLRRAGIESTFHSYPGSHHGEHWARNFREDLPGILDVIARGRH